LQEREQKQQEEARAKQKAEELAAQSDINALLRDAVTDDSSSQDDSDASDRQLTDNELVTVIGDAVVKYMDARLEQSTTTHQESMKAIVDQMESLKNVALQGEARREADSLMAAYPDAREYKKEIGDVLKMYPGISLEHAFHLAKSLAAGDEVPHQEVTQERGTAHVGLDMSPRHRQPADDKLTPRERRVARSGVAGFRNLASEGVARVLATRGKTKR